MGSLHDLPLQGVTTVAFPDQLVVDTRTLLVGECLGIFWISLINVEW